MLVFERIKVISVAKIPFPLSSLSPLLDQEPPDPRQMEDHRFDSGCASVRGRICVTVMLQSEYFLHSPKEDLCLSSSPEQEFGIFEQRNFFFLFWQRWFWHAFAISHKRLQQFTEETKTKACSHLQQRIQVLENNQRTASRRKTGPESFEAKHLFRGSSDRRKRHIQKTNSWRFLGWRINHPFSSSAKLKTDIQLKIPDVSKSVSCTNGAVGRMEKGHTRGHDS